MVRRKTGQTKGWRSDNGTALVETALVIPIFIAIVLGIIEFGLVYRDVLITSDAAATGARTGAVIGPRITATLTNADYVIVKDVRESLGSTPTGWVKRVVVFRASAPSAAPALSQVPVACRNGTAVAGICNVYNPQDAFYAVQEGDADYFSCTGSGGAGGPACSWRPTARKNGPSITDIEYLGVYVRVERPYVTGLFGDKFTIEQATIVRLEPGVIT